MTALDVAAVASQFAHIPIGRRGSFSDVEKFCLLAVLLDEPAPSPIDKPLSKVEKRQSIEAKRKSEIDVDLKRFLLRQKRFDESVLFQLPFPSSNNNNNNNNNGTTKRTTSTTTTTAAATTDQKGHKRQSTQFGRHEKKILGLWQAHNDGVHPIVMHKRKQSSDMSMIGGPLSSSTNLLRTCASRTSSGGLSSNGDYDAASVGTVKSDIRVLPAQGHDDDSSWGEADGGFLHYNAWEVLKDEYAEDFGFDFQETIHTISATLADEDDDNQPHVFRIIGTSAEDMSAQPHVLSPPLMDSLLNFVPDSISRENFWMKFSLIRDGASLYTLKQYIKATPNILLAIETTNGDVFGAFTSHTWKNHPTFFGGGPCFLWCMRESRRTPCHSLFEQAQMESIIDVYAYSGLNDLIQVCDDDRIAIGGGKVVPDSHSTPFDKVTGEHLGFEWLKDLDVGENFGFGITLDENLLTGTTSPCSTFRNRCLVDNQSRGEKFEVANLEAWSFTPCLDQKSAERMEMTRYFTEESLRAIATSPKGGPAQDIFCNPFATQDEFQQDFYRRVGHNQPTEHHRRKDSYQYNG